MRSDDDCQHQGGRELGWDGKANRSESLINVVRTDKPKVLKGLSQKARGEAQEFLLLLSQMRSHRRTGGAYPIHRYGRGTW